MLHCPTSLQNFPNYSSEKYHKINNVSDDEEIQQTIEQTKHLGLEETEKRKNRFFKNYINECSLTTY